MLSTLPDYQDTKTMDFLAIVVMLLFAALLFVSFALPALKEHTLLPYRSSSADLANQ